MGKVIQLKLTNNKAKVFLHSKLAETFPNETPWWFNMVAEIMQEYADKQNQIL